MSERKITLQVSARQAAQITTALHEWAELESKTQTGSTIAAGLIKTKHAIERQLDQQKFLDKRLANLVAVKNRLILTLEEMADDARN